MNRQIRKMSKNKSKTREDLPHIEELVEQTFKRILTRTKSKLMNKSISIQSLSDPTD